MADWSRLDSELDSWRAADRTATLWWRDDDATTVTPPLERLLAISAAHGTPVALAVIPRDADEGLRTRLAGHPQATVLQHGWSHANHAPGEERQEEFGSHRPSQVRLQELADGWQRIDRFACALPVLVAPWNRMDETLLPDLPRVGLHAVSTLGPRPEANAASGVRRTNVHVDLIDWQGSRGFFGLDHVLDQLVGHLAARRESRVDRDEPTGIMTHHSFHDEGCWWFIDALMARTRNHPAAHWLTGREAFWP